MYDTIEEVQQKLVNCLLIFQGKPVFVTDCVVHPTLNLSIRAYFTDDPVKKSFYIAVTSPELDIRNCGSRLGYLNVKSYNNRPYNECIYLMRMPRRQSQHTQGLSKANVHVFGFRGNGTFDLPPTGNLDFNTNIYEQKSKELADTFNGVYPSIVEIKKEFTKDSTVLSRAFNRTWAVRRDELGLFDLMYKNIRVGYSEDLNTFNIPERFRFHRSDLSNLNINLVG